MTKEKIITEIKARVNNSKVANFAIWRIGLTHNPTLRKEQYGSPEYWVQWEAGSLVDAQSIEDYFLNEFPENSKDRMTGGTGGNMDNTKDVYVYIY